MHLYQHTDVFAIKMKIRTYLFASDKRFASFLRLFYSEPINISHFCGERCKTLTFLMLRGLSVIKNFWLVFIRLLLAKIQIQTHIQNIHLYTAGWLLVTCHIARYNTTVVIIDNFVNYEYSIYS